MLPQSFSGLNFKKLLIAFDVNNNGVIEEEEFVDLLTKASKSAANTDAFKIASGNKDST